MACGMICIPHQSQTSSSLSFCERSRAMTATAAVLLIRPNVDVRRRQETHPCAFEIAAVISQKVVLIARRILIYASLMVIT